MQGSMQGSKEDQMMRHNRYNPLPAIVLAIVVSLTVFGQVTSSLSGVVTDPDGAVVAGASVRVKNVATGAEFSTTTSGNGSYTVPSLGTGTYSVTVSAPGFK